MEGDGGGKDDDDGDRGMSGGEMDEGEQIHTQHFICPPLSTSRLKTSCLLC